MIIFERLLTTFEKYQRPAQILFTGVLRKEVIGGGILQLSND
jgi:hypothetical protein